MRWMSASLSLLLLLTLSILAGSPLAGAQQGMLPIVADGEALAVVVKEDVAPLRNSAIANTVVEYIEKATGVKLQVLTESQYEGSEQYAGYVPIYINVAAPAHRAAVEEALVGLHEHGFVLHAADQAISIVGPSIWGTINGVYDFLERFVGVRWLMAGPYGEDVPRTSDFSVPLGTVREEPAFTLRVVSGGYSGGDPFNPFVSDLEKNLWAQRNRLQGTYNRNLEFHHNLSSLFPPAMFEKTHPEFYPPGSSHLLAEGKRWQPCFTAEGIVEAAIDRIVDFFNQYPDRQSFSLGVNDIGGFCEEDPSHPQYPGKTNSVGLVHMSEIYYAWVNEVVEGVIKVHPDKWFGLLAYREVVDPPSFPLHPRVVPIITKDRMAWLDDDVRREDHEQLARWNEVAQQVGWYDYMYGFYYYVPRVYPHLMAENLRYGADHQVTAFYAEMQYTAADGPKLWLLAKLLWDPYRDVDALLTEWYERTVGVEAAPYLAAFYEHWEEFWTQRVPSHRWFNGSKRATYLNFPNQSYLELVTEEDIARSKRLLETVMEKAQTDEQRARAALIMKAFEMHEAAALSYPKPVAAPANEDEALALLEELATKYDERLNMARRRYELIDEFRIHPHPTIQTRVSENMWVYWWKDWSGWNKGAFDALLVYLDARELLGGPVTERLFALTQSDDPSLRRFAAFTLMARGADVEATSITRNSSFEEADITMWRIEGDLGGTALARKIANSGDGSLLLRGLRTARISQEVTVDPGLFAAQVHFLAPNDAAGSIQLEVTGRNQRGAVVVTFTSAPVPLAASAGKWVSVQLVEAMPYQVSHDKITSAEIAVILSNVGGGQVYIDDLLLYQDVPPGAEVTLEQPEIDTSNISFRKPVRASSVFREYRPELAVDGIADTRSSRWLTADGAQPPHWLEIDLLGHYRLTEAEVWLGDLAASGEGVVYPVTEFELQYWTGSAWETIPGTVVRSNTDGNMRFVFDEPVITDKVRFYSEEEPVAVSGVRVLRVREIRIAGEPVAW